MNDINADSSKFFINDSKPLELANTEAVNRNDTKIDVANLKLPGELLNILTNFEIRMKNVSKSNKNEFLRLAERYNFLKIFIKNKKIILDLIVYLVM